MRKEVISEIKAAIKHIGFVKSTDDGGQEVWVIQDGLYERTDITFFENGLIRGGFTFCDKKVIITGIVFCGFFNTLEDFVATLFSCIPEDKLLRHKVSESIFKRGVRIVPEGFTIISTKEIDSFPLIDISNKN